VTETLPRVKICGITRPEDAVAAARVGADAVGLQFFEGSVRHVTPDRAAEIRRALPPFVSVVGVFANASREYILRVAERVGLEYVQVHGDEDPGFCRDLPLPTVRAVRVGGPEDLEHLDRFAGDALLLDAKVDHAFGGTGERFDWSLLDRVTTRRPLIVAGGLQPDNVAEAVRATGCYAVDVCTGVESAPAVKSYVKMERFVGNARRAGLRGGG
jgi:phosphoribosylanthranilate isomerase